MVSSVDCKRGSLNEGTIYKIQYIQTSLCCNWVIDVPLVALITTTAHSNNS